MDLSSARQIRRSRKGSCLFVSVSIINWMWGSMELMCWQIWSMSDVARAQQVAQQVSSIGTKHNYCEVVLNM